MSGNASQFVGNIPDNYDHGLGPHIFHDYADDLTQRAAASEVVSVLELAAGTGIVSRKLRDALPSHVTLTVTDLNPPMLAVAEKKFQEGENLVFHTADAMELPFDDGQFDLIVCQFGVMFFPDKLAAFKEALRVLRPGGSYLFNAWGNHAANPFAEISHGVAAQFFPDDPPQFYKVPFSYSDAEIVESDMRAAGFTDVTSEVVEIEKRVEDWERFARGIVYGNPLIGEIESRGGVDAKKVMEAILAELRKRFDQDRSSMPLLATVYRGYAAPPT